MRFKAFFGSLIVAATCAAQGAPARAADLGAFYAPEESEAQPDQRLTFGTGWYLRGDAAYSEEDHPALGANPPHALDRNATSSGYSVGIGAGYKLNSWFRADITGDYLDPFDYKTTQTGTFGRRTVDGTLDRWVGLANGYIDLGSWYGFTPYIGAGVGVGGTHLTRSSTQNGAPQSPLTRDDYGFAWAAMAGVTYTLTPNALIDIGYRYLDLGKTALPLYPLVTPQKSLSVQQVRVGIRYMID